jgi:hypothetical protein
LAVPRNLQRQTCPQEMSLDKAITLAIPIL